MTGPQPSDRRRIVSIKSGSGSPSPSVVLAVWLACFQIHVFGVVYRAQLEPVGRSVQTADLVRLGGQRRNPFRKASGLLEAQGSADLGALVCGETSPCRQRSWLRLLGDFLAVLDVVDSIFCSTVRVNAAKGR